MPLSIAFRWKTPNVQAAETAWEKNRVGENISQAAKAIGEGLERRRNRERQAKLDRMNEEDRQRRIDWENKQHAAYGEAADYIRGRTDERAQLARRAEEIKREIESLKAQLGG